jgi:hypothetical protein
MAERSPRSRATRVDVDRPRRWVLVSGLMSRRWGCTPRRWSRAQVCRALVPGNSMSANASRIVPSPSSSTGSRCHRHEVARLLRRAARRRGLSVHVQEWPGGRPSSRPLVLRVRPETLSAVAHGAKAVPLHRKRVPAELAAIPWGTPLLLKAGLSDFRVAVGPTAYRWGQWVLPRFEDDQVEPAEDVGTLLRHAVKLRRKYRLD